MSGNHAHDHRHDKFVKKAITIAAKKMGIARNSFHSRFVTTNDDAITSCFWVTLWDEYPEFKDSKGIDYCRGCKKFILY